MKISNECVVYTCSVHNYDNLSLLQKPVPGIKFVLFTNRPKKAPPNWEVRKLKSPPRLKNGHDINRFHKIFPQHVLPEFRYSIYLDGNASFNGNFNELIKKFCSLNIALTAFKHPNSHTLIQEEKACIAGGKFDSYDIARATQQLNIYKTEGLNLTNIIPANYFLIRDHNYVNFTLCMSLWWSHLFEYSKRDQMSLSYALEKTNLPWAFLDDKLNINPELLTRHDHIRKRKLKKARKLIDFIKNKL